MHCEELGAYAYACTDDGNTFTDLTTHGLRSFGFRPPHPHIPGSASRGSRRGRDV
jgi:hypothetical protein